MKQRCTIFVTAFVFQNSNNKRFFWLLAVAMRVCLQNTQRKWYTYLALYRGFSSGAVYIYMMYTTEQYYRAERYGITDAKMYTHTILVVGHGDWRKGGRVVRGVGAKQKPKKEYYHKLLW